MKMKTNMKAKMKTSKYIEKIGFYTKNKNIDISKYNSLYQIILTNVNNITSTYFTKADFLKYVSLDNI